MTGTYTYVQSRESDAGVRDDVALTPRHSVGIVAMAESEEKGRVGLEIYYTGQQRLDANPYRVTSEPYVIIGLLAEWQIRPIQSLHQRREPDRRPSVQVGSGRAARPGGRRPLDR